MAAFPFSMYTVTYTHQQVFKVYWTNKSWITEFLDSVFCPGFERETMDALIKANKQEHPSKIERRWNITDIRNEKLRVGSSAMIVQG